MEKTLIQYYIVKQHEGFDFIYKCLGRDFSRLNPKKQYLVEISEAVENPGKIQTEYEWKKERFKLLSSVLQNPDSETRDEWLNLDKWLKENKPENWQICTKENTKTGDVVRFRKNGELREFEHFCQDGSILLYNDAENKSFPVLKLENYEINLAEKD